MSAEIEAEVERCAHCDLPVPAKYIRPADERQFCCEGCRAVYGAIHEGGLEAFYKKRGDQLGAPAHAPKSTYEELDNASFTENYCTALPGGLLETDFYLEGIHCTACLWLVERALETQEGVSMGRLDFGRRRLSLRYAPDKVPLSKVAQRLEHLGYPPHPARDYGKDPRKQEERRLLVRIGVAGAVAMNVMIFAISLYGGWASGMQEDFRTLFRYVSLLLTLPAVLYSAWPFFKGAWAGLSHGVLHMDLPISIGILVGFIGGAVNTIADRGEVYFDSVSALIFLLLVGRWLQLKQQHRATERSELLGALTPAAAYRVEDGDRLQRIPLEAIRVGDHLSVPIGERIPTDGVVIEGSSAVDMSLLTGEAIPVEVGPDAEVYGGTTNLYEPIVFRATQTVRQARVGRITEMVVEAAEGRAPVVQLADKIAGYFVAVVLLLAVFTAILWSYLDPAHALDNAVSLLIVSCPCALGLATPLAITAAIHKAAQRGILIRTGAALEALGTMRSARVLFDKTGTLTHGQMDLVEYIGPDSLRPWIAAIEGHSRHPIGLALKRAFGAEGELKETGPVEALPGGGLTASTEAGQLSVGAPEAIGASRSAPQWALSQTDTWTQAGITPVWFALDEEVVAVAGLSDQLREDARAAVDALSAEGFSPEVVSGDDPRVAETVGAALSIPKAACHGRQSPEDKLARVQQAAREGPVVMVGDGVNDAAALAAATVGVAVFGGAETAFSAADVFLQRPGVKALATLVAGARKTVRVIRGNIIFSLVYNLIGAGLAISGVLHPLFAAILMPISSVIVVSSSFGFRFPEE